MRNLKKVLALVLALMMTLSLMVTASASDYADSDSIIYKEAVEVMSGIGVFNGGIGNKFAPKETLTREQAAKIITYMLLSKDVADDLKATAAPFEDVAAGKWSAGSIAYCASVGIVSGSGGKFYPAGTLTGYEFGKMLLEAIGIDGTYTGSNWKVNVATNLFKNDLDAGITGLVLSNALTREEACQLAFNALQYSAKGTSSEFVVKTAAGVELYRGTDAMAAAVIARTDETNVLTYETVSTGSLADTVFNIKKSTATDAFGRESVTWVDKSDATVVYASIAPTAKLTYTTATTYGKIVSALGYTKVADNVTFNVFNNSKTSSAVTANRTNTTAIGGQGTLIEVYAAGKDVYDVIVVNTYVDQLEKEDIFAAKAATGTTDAQDAYIEIDHNGSELSYTTASFKAGDVVLYTVADNVVTNVVKAAATSGMVTATASGYLRVNGTKMVLAACNNATIGTTAGYKYTTTDTYTYYLDSYGNIAMAVKGEVVAPDVNYVYVLSQAAKAAQSTGGGLYDETTTTAAQAQAQVMDLATGAIRIVNIGVVKGTDGKYYYADASGAASSTEVKDKAVTGEQKIYTYTELTDGSIVLGSAPALTSVTLKKGTASLGGNLIANSGTKVTVLTYTDKYASVSKTEYTGIANFPATAKTANALVMHSDNIVSSIVIVEPAAAVVTAPDYAVYAGMGEMGANGQAYGFYVNGEYKEYYLAKDVDASDAGVASLTAKDVVTLKLTDGKLGEDAAVKKTATKTGEVTYVDATFMIVDGTVYYFADGCETVDSNNDYAAGEVAVGNEISLFGDVVDGQNMVYFIVK